MSDNSLPAYDITVQELQQILTHALPPTETPASDFGQYGPGLVLPLRDAWQQAGTEGARAAWAALVKDRPELVVILSGDPADRPPVTWADLESVLGPVEWDWPGWLPRGFLTLLAGQSGCGKSLMALRIAATYTKAEAFPDGTPAPEQGAVLWVESEEAEALNLGRAQAWHLDRHRFYTPQLTPSEMHHVLLDDPADQEAVYNLARRPDVRLIVIDALRGIHRGRENDSEVHSVVAFLAAMARDTGKPILLTHHLSKPRVGEIDEVSVDRVRGSSAIVQPARVVWGIDAPDGSAPERKRLHVIKSNLAKFPEPIGFEIFPLPDNSDYPELIFSIDAPERPKTETVHDKALDFLRVSLARGPRLRKELEEEATGQGISNRALVRAKKVLGVVSVKAGGGEHAPWSWSLPCKEYSEGEGSENEEY